MLLTTSSGDAKVPVANCDQKHYDSQEKKTYNLQEYIQYWNGLRKSSEGKQLCLYLKVKLLSGKVLSHHKLCLFNIYLYVIWK